VCGALTREAANIAYRLSYYSIGMAFSADGRHFKRLSANESRPRTEGLALTARDLFPNIKFDDGIVSDPVAVRRDGVIHLWFSAFTMGRGAQVNGVGYANSTDLRTWKPHGKQVLDELGIPFVLAKPRSGSFELWANLDEPERERVLPDKDFLDFATTLRFRHYLSPDGINWKRDESKDLAYDPDERSEFCGLTAGPAAILRSVGGRDEYEMYYGAWGNKGVPAGSTVQCVWAINRAVLKP